MYSGDMKTVSNGAAGGTSITNGLMVSVDVMLNSGKN
jgi:hypothetical protein